MIESSTSITEHFTSTNSIHQKPTKNLKTFCGSFDGRMLSTQIPWRHQWSTNETPMKHPWNTHETPMKHQWTSYGNDWLHWNPGLSAELQNWSREIFSWKLSEIWWAVAGFFSRGFSGKKPLILEHTVLEESSHSNTVSVRRFYTLILDDFGVCSPQQDFSWFDGGLELWSSSPSRMIKSS